MSTFLPHLWFSSTSTFS